MWAARPGVRRAGRSLASAAVSYQQSTIPAPSRRARCASSPASRCLAVIVAAVAVTALAVKLYGMTRRRRPRGRRRVALGPPPRHPLPRPPAHHPRAPRRGRVAPEPEPGRDAVGPGARWYPVRLPGRLAQLGERRLDKAEVTGSSPVSPTGSPVQGAFLLPDGARVGPCPPGVLPAALDSDDGAVVGSVAGAAGLTPPPVATLNALRCVISHRSHAGSPRRACALRG